MREYQTVVEAILMHAEEQPDKLAVAFKEEKLSYKELARQIRSAAGILKQDFHIEKGDLVMLSAMSKPEYIVALFAIQYLNAVTVPIDKNAKTENICDVYDFIVPKLILTDAKVELANQYSLKEFYEKVKGRTDAELPYHLPDMDQLAEMLFTTGTTGKPKGGMHSYATIRAIVLNNWHGAGMEKDDVILLPLPLNHSVGMREIRTAFYLGATVILQNGFVIAKELENNIRKYHCTALISVPASIETVYRQMKEKFSEVMGGLRYMEIGAGSLSYDMKIKLPKLLPHTRIVNTWGSTETGGAIFLDLTAHPDKLTSLGKPVSGIEVRAVDSDGRAVAARDMDTAGRLEVRGSMQMIGYYHNPEITKETLIDGWLRTNDMVYFDAAGFVYMLGRADDIINVGGEKVSPIEVENIASEFDEIRECACIGVDDPDGILGQVPVLYYVPEKTEVDHGRCMKFLSEKMEKYKLPHRLIPIEELPRNRMKKLRRGDLKALWMENKGEVVTNAVLSAIFNRHSVREFTDREIPHAELEAIVKAGIQAPTGMNLQTWRFTVLTKQEDIAHLKEVLTQKANEKKTKLYGFCSPVAVILISNDRRNRDGLQDSSCAAENIMLAAASLGIGSVWNNAMYGLCEDEEVRSFLTEYGIPGGHDVHAAILLGYPKEEPMQVKRNKNVIHWI